MKKRAFAAGLTAAVVALVSAACQPSSPPEQAGEQRPPQVFCGGIGGVQCPAGYECEDDPSDPCDPAHGGADCSGICVSQTQACGKARCAVGQYCCNESCGICAPIGGACTQQVCD